MAGAVADLLPNCRASSHIILPGDNTIQYNFYCAKRLSVDSEALDH